MTMPTTEELQAAIEDAPAIIAFLKTLDPDQGIDTLDQDNCFYCKYLADRFPDTAVHANCERIRVYAYGRECVIAVEDGDFAYRVQSKWIHEGFETQSRRAARVFLFPPKAIEIVETVVFDMKAEETDEQTQRGTFRSGSATR